MIETDDNPAEGLGNQEMIPAIEDPCMIHSNIDWENRRLRQLGNLYQSCLYNPLGSSRSINGMDR